MAAQWGDYVWISFLFPLAGYSYLVHNDAEWSTLGAVALFAFFIVGCGLCAVQPLLISLFVSVLCSFELFRGSNLQKATIKANPHAKIWGKEAEFIDGKLLVSGYWGIGRKINYTGDLIIAYSFALTTGIPTWTGDWQVCPRFAAVLRERALCMVVSSLSVCAVVPDPLPDDVGVPNVPHHSAAAASAPRRRPLPPQVRQDLGEGTDVFFVPPFCVFLSSATRSILRDI